MMAKISLNPETAAALQEIIGDFYKVPVDGEIVTGDGYDETIAIQRPLARDGGVISEMIAISPDAVYYTKGCTLNADGSQVKPACVVQNFGDPLGLQVPEDAEAVRNFIAAIEPSEIRLIHRGSLDDTKVAQFRAMMGVEE